MGKKRLRGSGQQLPDATSGSPATPARRARVRNRLLVSVVLCAGVVLAAGVPGITDASQAVSESQGLVDRAELGQRAISLEHALADERDAVVRFLAAGRTGPGSRGAGESQRSRVDRGAAELEEDAPTEVRRLLDALPKTRREATAGDGRLTDAYAVYTTTIQALGAISASTSRDLPRRAANSTAQALPDLGHAVEQASADRGLLLAALAAGGSQPQLTGAAQQARIRERAALADFEQLARDSARESFSRTVNGTDVTTAERYLAELTDQPRLSAPEQLFDQERVGSTLSARIDRMRGVRSSLADAEVTRLEQLRDDDVTALQLRVALLAACLLFAVGSGVHTARSMARPLAAVRLGARRVAADPAAEKPVKYTGRDDEFADIVRSVNELRETAAGLRVRADTAEADNRSLTSAKDALAAEREQLWRELTALRERLDSTHGAVPGAFVQLALRNLGLVERQLALIESLEEKEAGPEGLATLFELDHMATRMRRHGENLLLLAGAEHAVGHHSGPVPLLDVLRAAISEIERYEQVELASLPPHAQICGFAADDVSHLVAELLDNATTSSPPDAGVRLCGRILENGEMTLSVQDEGVGMTSERMAGFNTRLSGLESQEPPVGEGEGSPGTGLYVVARLAARHGIRVRLREQKQGGSAAVVVLPRALLPDRPAPGAASGAAAAGTAPSPPDPVAEAGSDTPPARTPRPGGAARGPEPWPVPEPGTAEPEAAPAPHAVVRAAGPYLVAPGEHVRAGDDAPVDPGAGAAPGTAPGPRAQVSERRFTDKGLPRRTPRSTEPGSGPVARGGGVNAEELRRRLGGFQQGAGDGHRDVAAQIAAEQPAENGKAGEQDSAGADGPGGTVEEARQ